MAVAFRGWVDRGLVAPWRSDFLVEHAGTHCLIMASRESFL